MRLLRLLIALALLLAFFGAGRAAPATGGPPLRLHRAILETLPVNRSPAINALLASRRIPCGRRSPSAQADGQP